MRPAALLALLENSTEGFRKKFRILAFRDPYTGFSSLPELSLKFCKVLLPGCVDIRFPCTGYRVAYAQSRKDSKLLDGGRPFRTWSRKVSSPGSSPETPKVVYVGSCQNYGPFWGTLNNRCRIIIRTQKGTIILTTTLMDPSSSRCLLIPGPNPTSGELRFEAQCIVGFGVQG